MDKFEEIRPYYDHEVESKLRELASNKNVINVFLHSKGYHNPFLNSFLGLFLSFYLKNCILLEIGTRHKHVYVSRRQNKRQAHNTIYIVLSMSPCSQWSTHYGGGT